MTTVFTSNFDLHNILNTITCYEDVMKVKVEIDKEFDMKDFGYDSKILGIDIRRDKKMSRLCLYQETYLMKILDKFGMLNSKSVITPTNPQFKLSTNQSPSTEFERTYMNNIPMLV